MSERLSVERPARSARAALSVAAARLRAQPLRSALVVGGVALAFAMFVSVLGGSLVARQQALDRALADLPASARQFRIDRFGLPLGDSAYERADREAQRAFRALSGGPARRLVFFRELRVDGELVEIAAVDDLARTVHVRSGRLPRTCDAAGCELLQIGGRGEARLHEGGLRLDRVGIASLRDRAAFASISAGGSGGKDDPVLLLAPGVDDLRHLDALTSFFRIYSWVSPIRPGRTQTWDVDRILTAESRAQSILYGADPAFRLKGPDDALTGAVGRGSIAARRLDLVGGATSALLLGFAIIAAVGLRRGLATEQRRLYARGARRWQVGLARVAEIGSMTLTGALAGIAAGAGAVALIAALAGEPAGAVLGHGLLAGSTVGVLAAAWLAATVVLAATTFARDGDEGRRRVTLVDVAAVGAAAAVVVGLSRGVLDPSSVSSGNAALLLVLPALVCFVAAVALARALAPAMRLAERLTRSGAVALRLAVLALARAPLRTVVSCAFVAVALGLACFAASYRATLDRGAVDQASFQVPLDFTLAEGSRLVEPVDAAPIAGYERLPGVAHAYPALRLAATTPGPGSSVLSPTVLGVPAAAIADMRWRSDYSTPTPLEIAGRLAPQGEPRLAGVALPRGASALSISARSTGPAVEAGLVTRDRRGRTSVVPLGLIGKQRGTLTGRIDAGSGRRLVGLQLALPEKEQFFFAHRETAAGAAAAPSGALELGPLRTSGASGTRILTRFARWRLATGGRATRTGGGARIDFAFADTGARLVLGPVQPTDGRPMPVVVSPDIAAAAGGVGREVTLNFQDVAIDSRIVAVARRLPTIPAGSGPFALADEGWLSSAVDAAAPGRGAPSEVWLTASDHGAAAAALRRPPFDALTVASRASIEHRLASDPLARATARALAAAGIVALVLAVLGFWVGVLSELRDERSDFFDLEARGVPPRGLRAQLRIRALILIGFGILGGVVLGVLLSRLVVSLVRVSATTGTPEPPLRFDQAWLLCGAGVLAVAAAALLVVGLTGRAAFGGARPERASWSLE